MSIYIEDLLESYKEILNWIPSGQNVEMNIDQTIESLFEITESRNSFGITEIYSYKDRIFVFSSNSMVGIITIKEDYNFNSYFNVNIKGIQTALSLVNIHESSLDEMAVKYFILAILTKHKDEKWKVYKRSQERSDNSFIEEERKRKISNELRENIKSKLYGSEYALKFQDVEY